MAAADGTALLTPGGPSSLSQVMSPSAQQAVASSTLLAGGESQSYGATSPSMVQFSLVDSQMAPWESMLLFPQRLTNEEMRVLFSCLDNKPQPANKEKIES